MQILVTGAAGFIGFHVAQRLLSAGGAVVGLDIVNDYYDPKLKEARLDLLKRQSIFVRLDLADRAAIKSLFAKHHFPVVIHRCCKYKHLSIMVLPTQQFAIIDTGPYGLVRQPIYTWLIGVMRPRSRLQRSSAIFGALTGGMSDKTISQPEGYGVIQQARSLSPSAGPNCRPGIKRIFFQRNFTTIISSRAFFGGKEK